jgi:Secretion system C-terminal sorting domain
MRKFYLLGSKNVKRSLVLMALAVGSLQGLQAQCTNTPSAGPCTGGNVSQTFTDDNGDFTSAQFAYSAATDNFSVNAGGNSANTITSGVYTFNGGTGTLVGFTFTGTASLDDITISIVDANTATTYVSCTKTPGSFVGANQACVTLPLSVAAGTQFRYVIRFQVKNGAGNAGTIVFDNFANGGQATSLPVKLDNFDAAKDGGGVKLSWKASEEAGVAVYQVQRSADGVNFSTIGIVSAENKKSYTYTDVLPSSGNNFYRLRIVDVDNAVKISHIVSLKSKVSMAIEAYPNPVRDRMVVQHPKAISGTGLQLVSLTGQVLKDVQVPVNAVVTPMEVSGLSNGTYYIVFRSGSESFSQRITKQ